MMNKEQLISRVAEITEGTKKDATKSVDALFQVIEEAIASGEGINLVGFIKIEVKDVPAKDHRNPKDGSIVHKEAHKRPVAKLGKKLKDAANK
jgi:DNA-binding protein HU-beta